jgi:penicillin-binding protein 2
MVENGGRRLGFLALLALTLFATLGARLWFLQVMESPTFEQAVAANNTREIYTEAPRGQIFDAKGRLLAGREESLVVLLDWTELRDFDDDERLAVYTDVASELNGAGIKTKVEDLERQFQSARNGSLKPVVVAEDVGDQVWVSVQERSLAGFSVERQWIRTYPYGAVGSHIIGYTGTVTNTDRADELNAANGTKRYFPGDELGLAGVERLFESVLRGVPGLRQVEIDAKNRVIGTVDVLQRSVPGDDIYLTIDIDLQYAAEQILADELRLARQREACKNCPPHVAEAGSLVALDVTDGSVVAMASLPTFDPSNFVFGLGAEQFAYLRDRPDQPFLDRSTQGLYPPGSTFKTVTGYAALQTGARGEWEPWEDVGLHTIANCTDSTGGAGCVFENAGRAVLGTVDFRRAMEISSDTYFYSLGEKFWVEQETYGETVIQDTADFFGFGNPTGIQLPVEKDGRVPTPENRREEFGADSGWFTGDNVNLSIGQGDLLVTPLQLTNSYAMLATGGIRFQPRLIDRVQVGDSTEIAQEFLPRVANDEPLAASSLAPIRDGLLRVPRSGTAAAAFATFPLDAYPIAGKTGTAEVLRKADYSLFASFGPWPNPKYAVAAVLEEAGFGGDAAAPAVRRFYDLLSGFTPVPAAPLAGAPDVVFERPVIPEKVIDPNAVQAAATEEPSGQAPASTTTQPPAAPPTTGAPTTDPSTADPSTTDPSTTAPPLTVPSSDPDTTALPSTGPPTTARSDPPSAETLDSTDAAGSPPDGDAPAGEDSS